MKVFILSETFSETDSSKTTLKGAFLDKKAAQHERSNLSPDSNYYWSEIDELPVNLGENEIKFKAAAEAARNIAHNCKETHTNCERNVCMLAKTYLMLLGQE